MRGVVAEIKTDRPCSSVAACIVADGTALQAIQYCGRPVRQSRAQSRVE